MINKVVTLFVLFVFVALGSFPTIAQSDMKYPEAKKVDQVDDYFGTSVSDPYRWLEDPASDDSKAWIEAQNKVTACVS